LPEDIARSAGAPGADDAAVTHTPASVIIVN
jgi:hypothetical protein